MKFCEQQSSNSGIESALTFEEWNIAELYQQVPLCLNNDPGDFLKTAIFKNSACENIEWL